MLIVLESLDNEHNIQTKKDTSHKFHSILISW